MNREQKNLQRLESFGGLNRTYSAAGGELNKMQNLTTDAYPVLSTRQPRERVGDWTGATDVCAVNGHQVIVADSAIYWDGEQLTTSADGKKQFALVGGKLVVWPDRIYIDTGTGKTYPIAAKVTAQGTIADDKTITAASMDAPTIESNFYGAGDGTSYEHFTLYKNLSYTNGAWKYDEKYTRYGTLQESDIGLYFIGQALTGSASHSADANILKSEYYGQIASVASPRYTYRQYQRGGGLSLTDYFEVGDTISISGSSLYANNWEAAPLTGVDGGQLTFQDGTLIKSASYRTVTESITVGEYLFSITVQKQNSTNTETKTVKAYVKRTIRVGEQLYAWKTGTREVQSAYGTQEQDVYTVYVYDPKTHTMEELEEDTSTGVSGLTGIAISTIYTGAAEALTFERKCPNLAYICAHNNRLYGVSNEEKATIYNTITQQYEEVKSRTLFASALGYPTRFYSFEGLTTDSYAVAIGGNGDFTGICEYSNAVLAWKEDAMFRLTGDYPAEYYLRNYVIDGVKDGAHGSLTVINEALYYLAPCGVMRYTGSTPALISYNLGMQSFGFGAAGRDRMHYLVSMRDEDGTWTLYSYDTVHGLWAVSGQEQATSICRDGDRALLCVGGKLWRTAGGEETIQWEAEFPEEDEGTFYKKRTRWIRMDADVQGSATVFYRANDNAWQTLGTITNCPGRRVHTFCVDAIRGDRTKIRITGTGEWKLFALEREFVLGSER